MKTKHTENAEKSQKHSEKSENGNKTQETQFENGRFAAFDVRFAFDLIFAENIENARFFTES